MARKREKAKVTGPWKPLLVRCRSHLETAADPLSQKKKKYYYNVVAKWHSVDIGVKEVANSFRLLVQSNPISASSCIPFFQLVLRS